MFLKLILADLTNGNLLLGVVPESLGLLIFGFVLIGFAFSLRRIFNRRDDETGKSETAKFESPAAINTFEGKQRR
ncbi:MAG: hypothetical protein JWN60_2054 [Acidobacteria bacterium]|jgi:hypothetical protein|nr:hypothetical protein [Acidobacteriota bacterium]